MKRDLPILLFLIMAMSLLGIAGCGHDHFNEPYVIESGANDGSSESDEQTNGGDDVEVVIPSIYARNAVEETTWDLLSSGVVAIRAMDFNALMAPHLFTVDTDVTTIGLSDDEEAMQRSKYVVIERSQSLGGSMSAEGNAYFVRNRQHCAVFTTLDIHYDGFMIATNAAIDGDGTARLILTSHSCNFFQNIHADIRMAGTFTVGEQTVQEISADIAYETNEGRNSDMRIVSATVATDDLPFRCSDRNGLTLCRRSTVPAELNFCATEEDVCEVTPEGHEGCMRPEFEQTGAHCDMGCCSPLPPEANTCNGGIFEGRECDPALTPFFTTTYLLWGRTLVSYEVPIRCSDDGLWTLPCSEEFDTCPYGSQCYYPEDNDWGDGFHDFGYCSCLPHD